MLRQTGPLFWFLFLVSFCHGQELLSMRRKTTPFRDRPAPVTKPKTTTASTTAMTEAPVKEVDNVEQTHAAAEDSVDASPREPKMLDQENSPERKMNIADPSNQKEFNPKQITKMPTASTTKWQWQPRRRATTTTATTTTTTTTAATTQATVKEPNAEETAKPVGTKAVDTVVNKNVDNGELTEIKGLLLDLKQQNTELNNKISELLNLNPLYMIKKCGSFRYSFNDSYANPTNPKVTVYSNKDGLFCTGNTLNPSPTSNFLIWTVDVVEHRFYFNGTMSRNRGFTSFDQYFNCCSNLPGDEDKCYDISNVPEDFLGGALEINGIKLINLKETGCIHLYPFSGILVDDDGTLNEPVDVGQTVYWDTYWRT